MGSIVSGLFGGGDAESEAADVQAASSAEAIAEQRRQFDITQANLEPYRVASLPALAQYNALLGLGGTPSYGAPSSQQFGTGWQAGDAGTASQGAGGGLMLNLQELLANQERDPRYYEGKTQEEIGQAIQGEGINIADLPPGSEEFINFNGMGVGSQVGGGPYTSGATRGQGGAGWAGGGTQGQSALEAQQAAYASLTESPGQRFIRARAQRNLLQNSAAIGGLGGGNVRSALVEQGAGFAAQDLENRYSRLQYLIGSGQASAAQQGQLGAQSAANIGNLQQQQGQARASGILGAQQANAQLGQQVLGAGIGAAAGAGWLGAGAAAAAGGSAGAGALFGLFSDERMKQDIDDLDLQACFEAVVDMPLKSWRYLESAGLDTNIHIGPMAQEAPDMIRIGEMNGAEMLNLHDELMMIAGAIKFMKQEGMLTCH